MVDTMSCVWVMLLMCCSLCTDKPSPDASTGAAHMSISGSTGTDSEGHDSEKPLLEDSHPGKSSKKKKKKVSGGHYMCVCVCGGHYMCAYVNNCFRVIVTSSRIIRGHMSSHFSVGMYRNACSAV